MQVVGLGAQDDFNYALRFVNSTGVRTPTMLWDPSFTTWREYGITRNSSMILLNSDLTEGTESLNGFSDSQQQRILDQLEQFS